MVNEYAISRDQKLKQSYIYIANALSGICESQKFKSMVFTSSMPVREGKLCACRNICSQLGRTNKSVFFIDADIVPGKLTNKLEITQKNGYKEIRCININIKDFNELLKKSEESNDFIIINIPPVSIMADSLEYARSCKNAFLLERYLHSKYKDYENTLLTLKQAGVEARGVIAYR